MDTTLILANINRSVEFSKDEELAFIEYLEEVNYVHKKILLKEGELATGTWFINDGLLRSYHIDKEGDEHVLYFAAKDYWIGDISSSISGKPTLINIEAMTDTNAFFISNARREELLQRIPKMERVFRIMLEKHTISLQMRLLDMLSATAQERYVKFCDRYPNLVNAIPQKQIASYIGVTPEFYSKMRSKFLREN